MAFIPKGIIPAMVTPLTKEEKVYEKALRTFADYLIEGGSAESTQISSCIGVLNTGKKTPALPGPL